MEIWPNFFIVGAPKAGTSTLFYYLKSNSEIFMSSIKEPGYFNIGIDLESIFVPMIKNRKKYLSLFEHTENKKAIGESTTTYLMDPRAPLQIKKQIPEIIGFSEMSAKRISKDTGLNLKEAKLAKKRSYSYPFKVKKDCVRKVKRLITKYKFNYTRATSFHYIMGSNDKEKSVKILTRLYKKKYKNIVTVGLGNSLNDLPMLKLVNKPFLIKNKDGYDKDVSKIRRIKKINIVASKGWNKVILNFLKNAN